MSTESNESPTTTPPSERLLSIDALRGFDMFWIIGGDQIVRLLAKNLSPETQSVIDRQLEHAEWEGFFFYDLIFPLFLFLVGVVLPFSLGKIAAAGEPRKTSYLRIARRTAFLFGLGLLANGILRFDWANLRVTGVLQRIALCYGIAAIIYMNTNRAARCVALVAILAGYWALFQYVPAPETSKPADYSKEHNLGGYVDRHYLPGKILKAYYQYGDNEGLLSTIPAVGTTLLGVLAGEWLRSRRRPWTKAAGLLGAGIAGIAGGLFWGQTYPIIKNLWTGSFVLLTGGLSLILLGIFYAVIDVLKWRGWAFPLAVIGMNAITIYVLPRFVDFKYTASFFLSGVLEHAGDHKTLILALGVMTVKWLLLWFLYRHRIFLRV